MKELYTVSKPFKAKHTVGRRLYIQVPYDIVRPNEEVKFVSHELAVEMITHLKQCVRLLELSLPMDDTEPGIAVELSKKLIKKATE